MFLGAPGPGAVQPFGPQFAVLGDGTPI